MKPIAVIDFETTGLSPKLKDKIVEVGIVTLVPGQGIISTFETLVNPKRDIGDTSCHGIRTKDVINAPAFHEIAGLIIDQLRDCVAIAGHNVNFDEQFLICEFENIGLSIPRLPILDTMRLGGGGSLIRCCNDHGIEFQGRPHSALDDSMNTARLLESLFTKGMVNMDVSVLLPRIWPDIENNSGRKKTVKREINLQPPSQSFLEHLTARLSRNITADVTDTDREYRGMLFKVIEDGIITDVEKKLLAEKANELGLSSLRVKAIHFDYVLDLIHAAWLDRILTNDEATEIKNAAEVLGIGFLTEEHIMNAAKSMEDKQFDVIPNWPDAEFKGKTVCFTGTSNCIRKEKPLTDDFKKELVTAKGLKWADNVTKKVDILVVADPFTQSGNAQKARRYGLNIIYEPTFWRLLGISIKD